MTSKSKAICYRMISRSSIIPGLRLNYRGMVVKTVWYWYKKKTYSPSEIE